MSVEANLPATNKVAEITLAFWIMKICATTLGETAGDLLSMTLAVGYAASSLILLGVFVVSLVAQLRATRFHPALYWLVILTTSTAGTAGGGKQISASFNLPMRRAMRPALAP